MQFQAVLFIIFLVGSATADWMVTGFCEDYSTPVTIELENGNCASVGDGVYEMITTDYTFKQVKINYCTDSTCTDCNQQYWFTIQPFVNCTVTPTFLYSATTNPESAIISQLGGMVYGTGITYDNCTTTHKKSFYPANQCILEPKRGLSEQYLCKPGQPEGQLVNYDDLQCKKAWAHHTLKIEKNCSGSMNYSFCKFQN